MNAQEVKTVRITDPSHRHYGRIAKVVRESDWYTHVRVLYQDHVDILQKNQYVVNE
jgi:hypothetical protein